MIHANLKAGEKTPNEVNVVIEIPAHSQPVKYEIDKDCGALVVDRFMGTSMVYPANYGYVPETLSEDGDPVDVLVMTPFPINSGCVIPSRPIGVLEMTDEKGPDAKILAVPADHISKMYHDVKSPDDVPPHKLAVISHFFEHYKDLEEGKWVKINGWADVKVAHQEIISSMQRYQQTEAA